MLGSLHHLAGHYSSHSHLGHLVGEREMALVPLVQNNHCKQTEYLATNGRAAQHLTHQGCLLLGSYPVSPHSVHNNEHPLRVPKSTSIICGLNRQTAHPTWELMFCPHPQRGAPSVCCLPCSLLRDRTSPGCQTLCCSWPTLALLHSDTGREITAVRYTPISMCGGWESI